MKARGTLLVALVLAALVGCAPADAPEVTGAWSSQFEQAYTATDLLR